MSSCTAWPPARLLPLVGPFFYGPSPGPCTYRSTGGEPTTTTYGYQDGRVQSEVETSDAQQQPLLQLTYARDAEGKLISGTATDMLETFEYGADYLLDTTTRNGMQTQQVRYTLNARGYPISALFTIVGKEDRSIAYRYENCRLQGRTITTTSGTVTEELSYTYDSMGRVAARLNSAGLGDTYDYSCW